MNGLLLSLCLNCLLLLNQPQQKCVQTFYNDSNEKLGLYEITLIVENYFYFYCIFPTDINNLIVFTEKSINTSSDYFSPVTENIKQITLPYLEEKKNDIILIDNNFYFSIIMSKDTFSYPYSSFNFNPCNLTHFDYETWYDYEKLSKRFISGRFFNREDLPVIGNEYLSSELLRIQKEIQDTYVQNEIIQLSKIDDKQVTVYIPMEYKIEKGLFYFCTKELFKSDILFYQKMSDALETLCKENNLSRIILILPLYKSNPN